MLFQLLERLNVRLTASSAEATQLRTVKRQSNEIRGEIGGNRVSKIIIRMGGIGSITKYVQAKSKVTQLARKQLP